MIGSISKYRIIKDLDRLFSAEPGRIFRVLDVGVTGPKPLAFWKPLISHPNFELDGCDIDAESIETLKKSGLPVQVKRLEALSGYDLAKKFERGRYDVVVSTQVLEHMKHPARFLSAAAEMMKPGGVFYLTFDAAEHPRKHNPVKELIKELVVAVTGSERYHDKPLTMADVAGMIEGAGLTIEDRRYYSLHPLKELLCWETPPEGQGAFLEAWTRFEDFLHESGHSVRAPERYLNGLIKATK